MNKKITFKVRCKIWTSDNMPKAHQFSEFMFIQAEDMFQMNLKVSLRMFQQTY